MPIFESILAGLVARLSWQVIEPILDYYDLKGYVLHRLRHSRQADRVIAAYSASHTESGEEVFWREAINGTIREGSKVSLHNFQLSTWFPRKPGIYWTDRARRARETAYNRHVEGIKKDVLVFDVYGKTLMAELGGIGTVNLQKNRDSVLLTATASGETHKGIPLVFNQRAWQQLRSYFSHDRMIEVDLEGTVEGIPSQFDSTLLRAAGVPRIAVRIESVKDLKLKASRLGITVTPWTIFETSDRGRPYGFTYVTHELNKDSIATSVQWLHDYIQDHQGTTILTDFDETTNPLNARFPLGSCFEGTVTAVEVVSYCQAVDQKFGGT